MHTVQATGNDAGSPGHVYQCRKEAGSSVVSLCFDESDLNVSVGEINYVHAWPFREFGSLEGTAGWNFTHGPMHIGLHLPGMSPTVAYGMLIYLAGPFTQSFAAHHCDTILV